MTSRDQLVGTSRRLRRRHWAAWRFKVYCWMAIGVAVGFLGWFFVSIVSTGAPALTQSVMAVEIYFDPDVIDPGATGDRKTLIRADYQALVKAALRKRFPEVEDRRARRELYGLVSVGADFLLRDRVVDDPSLIGRRQTVWVPMADAVNLFIKDTSRADLTPGQRRLSDRQLAWLAALADDGVLETRFAWGFFTGGDSREPELAGILAALVGSFFSLLVCLLLSFPIGVLAAVYLQEFASRSWWADIVEININNLAAVPSIVFGLLGLAVFLNVFELPRSAPLVGGMVLALMTLPTVIIASRAALAAVPLSIREAALAVGANQVQATFHHVVPLALPGMLTGTIIGMARALGETAPLLMIGMVAFIADTPRSILDPATALPVQVFLWADSPERGFAEKTALAIIVLLFFLVCMNLAAVIVRKKYERRW